MVEAFTRMGISGGFTRSVGVDLSLATRVDNLEGNIYEYEIYTLLEEGTEGTITIPEGASIRLDQYPNANDCLLAKADAYGRPIDAPPVTSVGTEITATLTAEGEWTLSGEPVSYPVCLIYQIWIYGKDARNINKDSIIHGHVISGLRSPTAPNQYEIVAITGLSSALEGKVSSIVAGDNVTVDNTDPQNPIISAEVPEINLKAENISYEDNFGLDADDVQGAIDNLISDVADKQNKLTAGSNITIDDTDTANPIISATGGEQFIESVDSTITVNESGQASVTNPLPIINNNETLVNSFGENISNPRIIVDEFGHTNVKQVDSITVVTKNTPTLTSNSDANLTCNFSATTAWIAFAENTTSVAFTNNQAEINFQYVWDTEQESNLIAIRDGGRYAYGGNIELRIGGVWTKIIDFTLDNYSLWDSNTVNYLLFHPTPFNTDQIGQYLFTLPRKIKHTGIRINWTTFEPTWNSINVRGVIVADANFTYKSLLKTSYNSDRHQALQIYDRITNTYTPIVQPYFDRWRYTVESTANILYTDIVAGTLYRMSGSAIYLEAPNWAYTGIAYKFAVCNFSNNINYFRLRSTAYFALYKGKVYQGIQNIPIPPRSTFTCTLVGTRYYLIECSSPNSIQFPATAVASTDANELDDYEEGSANIAFTAGSGTITYGDRALAYCKVGRVVSLHGQLTVSAVSGSQSGALTITGLPFISASGNSYQSEIAVSISGGHGDMTGYRLRGYVINNTNTLRIEAVDITDGSLVDIADLITKSSIITIGGVYYANS